MDKNSLKKLELIVFDLDGTLLNNRNRITDETVELVNELKKLGMKFSFASGRLHSAIVNHAKRLNLTSPLISLDGSLIKSYPEGKIIHESYVKEKYVLKALNLANELLVKIALCHGDAIYYTDSNSLIPQLIEKVDAKYQEVNSYANYLRHTLEIVVSGENKKIMKTFYKQMQFPYSFGLATSFYKSHHHDNVYYLEIRNHGNSKGKGLKRLAKHLRVKMKRTAVMGDWYNDRSLFETKALKVAVANAVDEIKELADFITTRTNDEGGAAEFLEMVLEAKKN